MSDIGKVRLRVPSTIKPGEVVRARALVIHPMERIEPAAHHGLACHTPPRLLPRA